MKLSSEMERFFYEKYLGRTLSALSECSKKGEVSILTSNYIQVSVEGDIPNNQRCLVKITKIDEQQKVYGEFVSYLEK